ncbi:MAG TPA: hypothetical protein VMB75_03375, partial [Rhodocyclaceae bacterium]|nr:hypothetical protein [Rhodocyclaceae bacterium]
HTYATHFPVLWAGLLLLSLAWLRSGRGKDLAALATIFSLNGLLHMVLDSIVGDIWWFAPFWDQPFSIFPVRPHYKPWWTNFILHWSFALELLVTAWAIHLWRRSRAGGQAAKAQAGGGTGNG